MQSNNSREISCSRGFTLVEVMVALFVVAIAASAILFQMMAAIDNTVYLRDKLVANWVAMNQITLERINNRRTNTVLDRAKSGQDSMLGRDWYWQVVPEKTSDFTRLTVQVSDRRDGAPVVQVFTFTDTYHQ